MDLAPTFLETASHSPSVDCSSEVFHKVIGNSQSSQLQQIPSLFDHHARLDWPSILTISHPNVSTTDAFQKVTFSHSGSFWTKFWVGIQHSQEADPE
jgi:hypothetical protein